jgi:hypothetical protein
MPDRFPTDTTSDPAGDPATTDLFGNPISVYTRAQAVADGVLVDVTAWASTGRDGMLGGFTVPVAFTHTVWAVIDIAARDNPHEPRWRTRARQRGESTRGRAHDVLWLAAVAARCAPDCDIVRYAVLMTLEGTGGSLVPKTLRIKARIDGDGVTIGFPEDF